MNSHRSELRRRRDRLILRGETLLDRERTTVFSEFVNWASSATDLFADFGRDGEQALTANSFINFQSSIAVAKVPSVTAGPTILPNEEQADIYSKAERILDLIRGLQLPLVTDRAEVPLPIQMMRHAPIKKAKGSFVRKWRPKNPIEHGRQKQYARVLEANPKLHGARFYKELEKAGIRPSQEMKEEGCSTTYPEAYRDKEKWRYKLWDEKSRIKAKLSHGLFKP